MKIRRATAEDLKAVSAFYNDLIDQMHENDYYTAWEKNVYPDEKLMAIFIEAGTMYIGIENDRIIASMVLNREGNEVYNDVRWSVDADPSQVMVLHILGVSLREKNRGLGRQMLEYARDIASAAGVRAIRMDVHVTNITAQKLYEKNSYIPVDRVKMYYEGIGWHEFIMYELKI